jgi:hypothetical protein
MVDDIIALFKSLNQYNSDDIRAITIQCGETMLRYVHEKPLSDLQAFCNLRVLSSRRSLETSRK